MDVQRDNGAWLAELGDPTRRDAAAAELHDFLRRTLARGFGAQLSDADLDDLAQDTVIKVQERLDEFRGDSRLTSWAASIGVNAALQELRKRKHRGKALEAARHEARTSFGTAPEGPDRVRREQLGALLQRAIDEALTEAQREALLAELGGLPMMEIARRTGRSRGALYKMLHDARKRLRAHLEAQGIGVDDVRNQEVAV